MKTTEEIIELVRNLKEEIEHKYKAEIIGIFGSYSRGEQREDSDVDILVKFHKGATLFDLVGETYLKNCVKGFISIIPPHCLQISYALSASVYIGYFLSSVLVFSSMSRSGCLAV